ncbi:MAG TPA: Tim44 domain-containing protein [Hyphomicrobiales bacterium]|nr:Tim44 domain-containing protein [Hyphomicrobiales bacterium]
MFSRSSRVLTVMAALALAFTLATAGTAEARMLGGGSFGSRGARTFSPPPVTRTAPAPAAPIQRSFTPQNGAPGSFAAAPGGFARPGFFGGGFLGGLATGFLGAGLFGLVFGHGFFGGLAGGTSILGLLIQLALVFFVVRWAMRRFGLMPATYPGGPAASWRDRMPSNGFGGGSAAAAPPPNAPGSDGVGIGQADLDRFEHILATVQEAFGREDVNTLHQHLTPEMLSYVTEELTQNASRGVVNRLADIRLLQGDLAEAWREGQTDYATVAMRYSLSDTMVDRASGRLVSGDPSRPVEVVEVWTFRRASGGQWLVSAIQQS